jgi:hypothetical protein
MVYYLLLKFSILRAMIDIILCCHSHLLLIEYCVTLDFCQQGIV